MAYNFGVYSEYVAAMIPRLLQLPKQQSLLLFGARNTGKSTLVKHTFSQDECLWFDLLDPEQERRFVLNPQEFTQIVKSSDKPYVIIDEIQKAPRILDLVHMLIESTAKHFVMTGSSARKLKRGSANLLAGRALFYKLYPFSFFEIEAQFRLTDALSWGMLPKVLQSAHKKNFLQTYAHVYLKEEIFAEQLVRGLDPFRRFLELAAQMNGKIINFSKIANDVGSDDKTIKNYFSILEDTLIGFFLPSYQHSFRKRLQGAPKFYFFDTGVTRALANQLSLELLPSTYTYGDLFEQFIILECIKLSDYAQNDFRFNYLRTKDDAEIDLVVERPGKPLLLIEIKSTNHITEKDLSSFIQISKDMPNSEAICLSCDPYQKQFDHVLAMPWQDGLRKFFT